MCLKRRASLFTIIAAFSFANLIILGICLGSDYWIGASSVRDVSKLNATSIVNSSTGSGSGSLPLKGFIGSNPIDGSDPGAFRGLMHFGLFSGCKRFNYGLGVRDPSCFLGKHQMINSEEQDQQFAHYFANIYRPIN